jgi:hypothetical protein
MGGRVFAAVDSGTFIPEEKDRWAFLYGPDAEVLKLRS